MPRVVTTSSRNPRSRTVSLPTVLSAVAFVVALVAFLSSLFTRPSEKAPAAEAGKARSAAGQPVVPHSGKRPGTPPPAPAEAAADAFEEPDVEIAGDALPAATGAGMGEPLADAAKDAPQKVVYAGIKGKEYFDNPVENLLAVASKPGTEFALPPRVNLPDEEIMAYLKRPVEIYDDDDDDTVAAKERAAAAKTDALAFIAAGGTYNQFLRDMAAASTEQAAMVEDVRLEMMRLFRREGREKAEDYLETVNPHLREQGLPEVVIPELLVIQVESEKEGGK